MKKIAIFLVFMISASSAYAVDGFRNVKFGASIDELKNAHICNMKDHKSDTQDMKTLYCEDFKFAGKKTTAFAIFLNDKFERFAITVNGNDTDGVIAGLVKKYGEASSVFTKEEYDAAIKNGGNLFIKFDGDTVILQMNRDSETLEDTTFLTYTSKDFEEKLALVKSNSLKEDL
ncbi:hypothetical protein [Obesumbacterium proteus]|uniref:Uncharacterized protein n=1 Tax=Obesumbacterium proteus ATCC 12841 TaxID=1354268 RepID=A0AA91EGP2_9GAMM|nr:hypothetical protein [Obesumbacterium proteus]AMO79734.1 hypothetical protein DSM2777_00840 [Obesumbacterium proteus]OAT58998.1 hypothetical protein M993_02301 [Obesumbacterium proteus ATCC 12841]